MSDAKTDTDADEVVAVEGALDAIKLLVENGATVSYGNHMLYKSGKTYRVLCFNKNGNLVHNEEKNFTNLKQAVRSFGELSNGKLG